MKNKIKLYIIQVLLNWLNKLGWAIPVQINISIGNETIHDVIELTTNWRRISFKLSTMARVTANSELELFGTQVYEAQLESEPSMHSFILTGDKNV